MVYFSVMCSLFRLLCLGLVPVVGVEGCARRLLVDYSVIGGPVVPRLERKPHQDEPPPNPSGIKEANKGTLAPILHFTVWKSLFGI